ncbi:MAG: sigma 54-interacting transcriptional regulator [Desulfomonilaceae bacterium]|nr:sigma 54-interacting transcriptional regulator [Desulfomonilaceae bacterium]
MDDTAKTREELISELGRLRGLVKDLQKAGRERRTPREALEECRDRYRKVMQATRDGIVVTTHGTIVEVDDQFVAMAARSPRDVIGRPFSDFLTDGTKIFSHARAGGDIKDVIETGLRAADGSVVPVELSTEPFTEREDHLQISVVRDLTPVIEAHRAEKEIEERFRAVFMASPDVIYLKDENLRLTHVNPAMEELFGLSSEELIASKAEDLYGARAAEQIDGWDARVLDGEVVEEEHTRLINGNEHTFLDTRVPIRGAEGRISGVCCISRDITHYKRSVPRLPRGAKKYRSPAMAGVLAQAAKIASTNGTVLLLGPTGVGKDYLAQWIHHHSTRSSGPYFSINCAALSPELAESELFGHESGAFTGARGRKKGMLELAEGGTLLLNEIGELPLVLQSKLLTFLDTMSFIRVGGVKSVSVDARLVAATHRDLEAETAAGRFLEPLYYRLNVFQIVIPPLKDRTEDIPILVEEIMAELAGKLNLTQIPQVDEALVEGLAAYSWPGNVRELKNAVERSLMLWDGGPLELKLSGRPQGGDRWTYDLPFPSYWTVRQVTDEVTKAMCIEALRRTHGNKKDAAKILGISRDALYRYIRRFRIHPGLVS